MDFNDFIKLAEVKKVLDIYSESLLNFNNSKDFFVPVDNTLLLTANPDDSNLLTYSISRYLDVPRVRKLTIRRVEEYKKEFYFRTSGMCFKLTLDQVLNKETNLTHLSICYLDVTCSRTLIRYSNDLNMVTVPGATEFRYVPTNRLLDYIIDKHTFTNKNKRFNLEIVNRFKNG